MQVLVGDLRHGPLAERLVVAERACDIVEIRVAECVCGHAPILSMNRAIASARLRNQRIEGRSGRAGGPASVVAALGAVQSQEFDAAKWALGLRMRPGATDAAIERAFADGRILRTHVLRPTWHFVPRDDIRWMLGSPHRTFADACRLSPPPRPGRRG